MPRTEISYQNGATGSRVSPHPGTQPVRVGAGWLVTVTNHNADDPLSVSSDPTWTLWIADAAITSIRHPSPGMLTILNGGTFPNGVEDQPCLCGAPESQHYTRSGPLSPLGELCPVTGKGQG